MLRCDLAVNECCMQQNRCICSLLHATFQYWGSTVELKLIKSLEEGNDALIITKETTKLTKLRMPG